MLYFIFILLIYTTQYLTHMIAIIFVYMLYKCIAKNHGWIMHPLLSNDHNMKIMIIIYHNIFKGFP